MEAERLLRILIGNDNRKRKIAENVLAEFLKNKTQEIVAEMCEVVRGSERREVAFMVICKALDEYNAWQLSSQEIRGMVVEVCVQTGGSYDSVFASMCLASVFKLQSEYNLTCSFINNHMKFNLKFVIRTLGLLCEKSENLSSEIIGNIWSIITKGIKESYTKLIALQAFKRSLRMFSSYIDRDSLGLALYKSYNDPQEINRTECLEAIYEFANLCHPLSLQIDIILFAIRNEVSSNQIIALEILMTFEGTIEISILKEIANLIHIEELYDSCIQFFIKIFKKNAGCAEEIIEYYLKFPFVAMTLIGCLPLNFEKNFRYIPFVLGYLYNEDTQLQEVGVWVLSQIVRPVYFKENFQNVIMRLLEFIFPSVIVSTHTKLYSCWALMNLITEDLSQRQIEYLIERLITVEGDLHEIFAAWAVVNELIQISTAEYIKKRFLSMLLDILDSGRNIYKIDCIFSSISQCLVKMPQENIDPFISKIISFSIKSPFTEQKAVVIAILATLFNMQFEGYLNISIEFLSKNQANLICRESLTSIERLFPYASSLLNTIRAKYS